MHHAARQPLWRPGLLEGQVVAVAGRAAGAGRAAAAACGEAGAHVEQLGDEGHRLDLLDEPAVQSAVAAIAAPEQSIDTVVMDAASVFTAQEAPDQALSAATTAAWVVARAAATRVMIDAPRGGKVMFLAPTPDAGRHAGAARAALENLARTLSIEWSRHRIRTTTIAPGSRTRPSDIASLVVYLGSPAGDYFSGCVFSLEGTAREPA
jgi:NAD(P)-dependent dehydrogenase (short-subunit alcohol dehydrogenase family)